jgi:ABC-type transport system involved in multi-copper enzyme maturation permease subunit
MMIVRRQHVWASASAELLKLRKRPAIWVLAGVWLALLTFFGYLLPYLGYLTGDSSAPRSGALADTLPANLVGNAVAGYALFGGAIVMILGALVAGSEYGWGTIKTVLTQRPGRASVYAGSLVALAAALLALVLVSFGLSAVASAVIANAESLPLTWPAATDVLTGIAAGWLILGMWCLFGVLLGTLTRGTAMAIGLGLVWALVVENLVRASSAVLDVLVTVQQGLPGVNAGSLVAALGTRGEGQGDGTPGVAPVVDGTQATVVLVGFVVAFAVIAGLLQARRDVV